MSFMKTQVELTKSQIEKLRKAIEKNSPVKFRMSAKQIQKGGQIPILINKTQMNKMKKAMIGKKGMMINLSQRQIREMKKDGGILPFLIPLAPIAIAGATALATGALSAVGGIAVNKIAKALEKKDGEGLGPFGTGLGPFGTGFSNPVQLGSNVMNQGLPPVSTPNPIEMMPIGGQIIQPEIKFGGQILKPEIKIGGRCQCGRLVGQGLYPIGTRTKLGSGLFPMGVPPSQRPRGNGLAPFGTKP